MIFARLCLWFNLGGCERRLDGFLLNLREKNNDAWRRKKEPPKEAQAALCD